MGGSSAGCREQGRARHTPAPSCASAPVVPCDVAFGNSVILASGPGRYQTGLVAFTCDWTFCLHWPCGKVSIPATGRLPPGMAPGLFFLAPFLASAKFQATMGVREHPAWTTTQPCSFQTSGGQQRSGTGVCVLLIPSQLQQRSRDAHLPHPRLPKADTSDRKDHQDCASHNVSGPRVAASNRLQERTLV